MTPDYPDPNKIVLECGVVLEGLLFLIRKHVRLERDINTLVHMQLHTNDSS